MRPQKLVLTACIAAVLFGCKKEEDKILTPDEGNPNQLEFGLGGVANEDLSEVPVSTKFGYTAADNLPSSVDLSPYLPPVGHQGQYGTCASWSTGYYAKTTSEGIAKGYTATQLSNAAYQISPRDLFTAIPEGASSAKGDNCNGSSFTDNLDVLQERGAATLSVVPYTNMGNCSKASSSPAWDAEAAKHKIKSYRLIDPTIVSIKQQLVNKVPIILGAKLADNFMTWNSDNVLSSNTTYTKVGQHAYHALTIVGYDDHKGANGAFKIVNSWGTTWGSKGFIWVDYNFLLNTFITPDEKGNKELIVISETTTKPQDDPQPNPGTKGVDLVAWVNQDFSSYQSTGYATSRTVDLNIYNDGSADAKPQTPWTAYYIYYNARNANDYGVLFHHTYTNKNLASGKVNCDGSGNCNLNVPIPSGSNLSDQLFGHDEGVQVEYIMPSNLNGSYYLVLVVDADGTFDESYEDDNFFYTTDRPIKFRNGYAAREGYDQVAGAAFSFKNQMTLKSPLKSRREFNSVVKPGNLNAYSPQEIFSFIRQQKKSGAFTQKLREHDRQNATQSSIRSAKSK
ncbi:C1 family peptidase [Spirosoma validum]|uniref:C1 family peptidase n=1 Tax=Spirosoma validum TaxID=2771355 RepID=A0A927GD69_9BACT|nr:C1 family peptidase [Spirosoma validum]MBD2753487.1 C1 family peptidase [Spirosoma validum]